MDISVTPSEVRNFASQLRQWASNLQTTRLQIASYSQRLANEWKDPQYLMFADTAKAHGATLEVAIKQFETMSKQLELMSTSLERTRQEMQQRINSMR